MSGTSNKQALLTICIPTYNRDCILEMCLARVCPMAQQYNVNICISDNCSSDKTESIVKKYMQQYSNIAYVKQIKNIGPDANFEYVLRMSATKFSWLLGDACYIDGIELLLAELQREDWDLFIVGDAGRLRMKNKFIKTYSDSKLLLKEWGWHMTWLSCLIYNKRLIEQANYSRYYNSRFLQTGIIFEYFSIHPCRVAINSSVTAGGFNVLKTEHWRHIAFEIFCRNWYLFVMSLPVYYSYEEKLYCIQSHGVKSKLFTWKSLYELRQEGILNLNILHKYRFFIKQTILVNYLFIFLIAIIPHIIIKIYNMSK